MITKIKVLNSIMTMIIITLKLWLSKYNGIGHSTKNYDWVQLYKISNKRNWCKTAKQNRFN